MALWLHICNVLDCSTSWLLTWCGRLYSPRNHLLYNSVLLGWNFWYIDSSILSIVVHWWLSVMYYSHRELVNKDHIVFTNSFSLFLIMFQQSEKNNTTWCKKAVDPDLQTSRSPVSIKSVEIYEWDPLHCTLYDTVKTTALYAILLHCITLLKTAKDCTTKHYTTMRYTTAIQTTN